MSLIWLRSPQQLPCCQEVCPPKPWGRTLTDFFMLSMMSSKWEITNLFATLFLISNFCAQTYWQSYKPIFMGLQCANIEKWHSFSCYICQLEERSLIVDSEIWALVLLQFINSSENFGKPLVLDFSFLLCKTNGSFQCQCFECVILYILPCCMHYC